MNYTFNISPERLTLAVLLALSAGWALGQWWRAREIRRSKSRIRRESREIILDAKRVGQATIANAEIEAKGIINTELDRFNLQRGEQLRLISEREQAIARRMDHLSSIETELSENRIKLEKKEEELKFKNHELSKKIEQVQNELQSIAGITFAEARNHMTDHLRDSVRNEIQEELGSWIKQSQEKVKEEAITLLLSTSERISRSVMAESFITVVPLAPEMKGRIIGRDGRNIRAFEAVAGVDLVLDDTSDSLVISSHNPERRVKAQMTLEKLFEDGRIQPTRIEEFYKSTEAEFISNTC